MPHLKAGAEGLEAILHQTAQEAGTVQWHASLT